jgi:hypothetical protein
VFFIAVLYHLKNPLLGLEKVAALSNTMILETIVAAGDEPYLWFKPPQAGVHNVPKWLPTVPCLEAMLRFVGYEDLESLALGDREPGDLHVPEVGGANIFSPLPTDSAQEEGCAPYNRAFMQPSATGHWKHTIRRGPGGSVPPGASSISKLSFRPQPKMKSSELMSAI